ncbi:hypothetical protein ANCCAN_08565 [Ancylostoma caninum]|uniref:Uncharacterized protein n=1 Tax=Ancylostoma caninum TaxID=29170 RepID=A0A368GQW4_ANCCA|nr:hypothetical protein ANCCAN_08565 [Ancylostoma caninum]
MRSSTVDAGDRKAAPAPRPSHGPGPPRPHPPHGAQQGPRNYKTLYDKELGAKETIRRYNGHIPGHPKVDRNTIFYPKVEVAMFELNDNVNKAFLKQLANKVAPPIDLDVFYHPVTKKHMGMAMIVFPTYQVTLLSQRYEDATGEEMRIPVHLKSLEETILNTRRSQYAAKNEGISPSTCTC